MNVVVGDNVIVGVGERIVMDCGPLIDATGVSNPMINWFHDGIKLSNKSGSGINVVISQDERLCIIIRTSLTVGGQIAIGGSYTCEVCSNSSACNNRSTIVDVCG